MKENKPCRFQTKQERYQSRFLNYNILNQLSFMLLSGNIPALFALQMGATGTYIGILGSLNYLTNFFMPIGRSVIRGHRIIGVFGWSWMIRYLAMIPTLLAPFLAKAGFPSWGLVLLLGSSFLFSIFRGIGTIGNNPVLGSLARDKDRGTFLSTIQIVNSITAIITSFITMVVLSKWTGNFLYGALLGVGILSGCIGSAILLGIPEPKAYRPPKNSTFFKSLKEVWSDKRFRKFVFVFAPLSFAGGTCRTFIVTHARVLYDQNAGLVMAYYVAFNIGSVIAGFLAKKLMDRVGSKPLYIVFMAVLIISIVTAAWSPIFGSATITLIFLSLLNFLMGLGICGEENAGQTYFFSIIKPEYMVDLAMVYYIIYGIGGSLGSFVGGIFLDFMALKNISLSMSYRVLFIFILLVTLICITLGRRLTAADSASVRKSLGIIFSFKDLKAIGLLEKLEKSGSPSSEIKLIHEVGDYRLWVSEQELLPYLSSPRLNVRVEALLALENLDKLSNKAMKKIAKEITKHPYTTAYIAARILGKRKWLESIPDLRNAMQAKDYMLQGTAVTALAALNDEQSLPLIEELITTTDNPRTMISAADAIESFGKISSVPILVSVLKKEDPPPYAFDEIVLAMVGILGGLNGFYNNYSSFLLNRDEAIATMLDILELAEPGDIPKQLTDFVNNGENSALIAKSIISGPMDMGASTVLAEAAIDDKLANHPGFRFFLAACAVESMNKAKASQN